MECVMDKNEKKDVGTENNKNNGYEGKGYLMEDFRLFHLRDIPNTKIEYHYHEFYKLLFLISGKGSYYIEGKKYLLKTGDVVLVGKQCVHRPEFDENVPYERMILYISPQFLETHSSIDCDFSGIFMGKHGHVLRPDESTGKLLSSHLLALEKELREDKYGKIIVSRSILLRLIVEIERSFLYGRSRSSALVLPKNKQIQEIMNYIDTHLTEDISIDDLAEKFYLSRFHMMRKFKEETGITIHNYLSDQRLFTARDLINQGYSSTDACFMCGFRSYASFSRAYGKLFGITPTGRKTMMTAVEETYE